MPGGFCTVPAIPDPARAPGAGVASRPGTRPLTAPGHGIEGGLFFGRDPLMRRARGDFAGVNRFTFAGGAK